MRGRAPDIDKAMAALETRRMSPHAPLPSDSLQMEAADAQKNDAIVRTVTGKVICPRTPGQRAYIEAMRQYDMVISIGPAGT